MVIAEWTGSYPCLCSGVWKLFINGEDFSLLIPEELRYGEMGTYGTYQSWHFENWTEVFDSYTDGLQCEEWIAANPWVQKLPASPIDVFYAIQAVDWRHGECGGCI